MTRPIADLAAELGLPASRWSPVGWDKAKLVPDPAAPRRGRLVLVSAMTPNAAGAGKTTVTVGLADGLAARGVRAAAALREPSVGPTLGKKGGGTGGGRARIVPSEDIDLHFTGDLHAVGAAHNLLAALIDHHLHTGNALGLEPRTVTWPRVLDLDDRALREVIVGLGGRENGHPRETGFVITAASEVMAILCLAQDAADLRARLARVIVGRRRPGGEPVTAEDVRADGAMALLLRHATLPNLVQTAAGTPAVVHGGPFANIAQGTNSVIATRTALALADVVVTEAGFGFDLGAEKLLDLVAPVAGVSPEAIVLVATCRALKVHGGAPASAPGADPSAVRAGLPNLAHHLALARRTGAPVVIALNRHAADSEAELGVVQDWARDAGVPLARFEAYDRGPEGAVDLAAHVQEALAVGRPAAGFQVPGDDARANVERLCREVYGADGVTFTGEAEREWRAVEALGLSRLPVCVAKTAASLSDDPKRLGAPRGFTVTVRSWRISAGAGFLVPVAGDIQLMPGLPAVPAAFTMAP